MSDSVEDADILPSYRSDHSAIYIHLKKVPEQPQGRGYWKLNNTFLKESDYIKGITENKDIWLREAEQLPDPQSKWEFIKYKIRQYSIS